MNKRMGNCIQNFHKKLFCTINQDNFKQLLKRTSLTVKNYRQYRSFVKLKTEYSKGENILSQLVIDVGMTFINQGG